MVRISPKTYKGGQNDTIGEENVHFQKTADFSIREIFRKMQKINLQINLRSQRQFPKHKEKLLSFYEYKRAKIHIKKGKLVGGLPCVM